MEILLTRYHWLQLSNEQRIVMREFFDIPRSGGVEMMGNRIMSDGSNESDLRVVSSDAMLKFLGKDGDFPFESLYEETIQKVNKIIQEREDDRKLETMKENASKRIQDTDEIVEALLETIINLPLDAQMRIKVFCNGIGEEITEQKEHAPVKKGGRPKKVKEGSNIEGTEGAGSGGISSEDAG